MSPVLALAVLVVGAVVGAAVYDSYLKAAKKARSLRQRVRAFRRLRLVLTTSAAPARRRGARR